MFSACSAGDHWLGDVHSCRMWLAHLCWHGFYRLFWAMLVSALPASVFGLQQLWKACNGDPALPIVHHWHFNQKDSLVWFVGPHLVQEGGHPILPVVLLSVHWSILFWASLALGLWWFEITRNGGIRGRGNRKPRNRKAQFYLFVWAAGTKQHTLGG